MCRIAVEACCAFFFLKVAAIVAFGTRILLAVLTYYYGFIALFEIVYAERALNWSTHCVNDSFEASTGALKNDKKITAKMVYTMIIIATDEDDKLVIDGFPPSIGNKI